MQFRFGWIALSAGLLMTPTLAAETLAQTVSPPAAGSKQVIPEKQAAPIQSGRSDSLSKKLSETNGVIKPTTDVDPGMKVPTPETSHQMPVIPPAATGGGTAK